MTYKLQRELVDGKVTRLSLGVAEVDAYLKFLQYRCRPNTWISYGYDLQIFLNFIRKPLLEVTSADILTFIDSQQSAPNRQGRTSGLSSKGPGLSNRTINRRLAAVANFYEYLRVFHDLPGNNNPVPRSLAKRNVFWANRYGNTASLALIRVPQTLPRPLDPEEISPFMNSLLTHRDKAMVLLMLLAGLRKSEVLKLGMKDIDFGQRTLTVREGKGGHQRVVAISDKGLPLFIRGDYDTAVFQAFKEVEIRVRLAASLSDELVGVPLMRTAFHTDNGALTDKNRHVAERQATSDLFAGAIGLFKNPSSHRDVNWDDPIECAELIYLANHLIGIVEKHKQAEVSGHLLDLTPENSNTLN